MKIETFSSDKKIIHSGTTILFNNDSDLIFKLSTESDDFNFDLKLVFKDDKENNKSRTHFILLLKLIRKQGHFSTLTSD